jgi:hypothetical protein
LPTSSAPGGRGRSSAPIKRGRTPFTAEDVAGMIDWAAKAIRDGVPVAQDMWNQYAEKVRRLLQPLR